MPISLVQTLEPIVCQLQEDMCVVSRSQTAIFSFILGCEKIAGYKRLMCVCARVHIAEDKIFDCLSHQVRSAWLARSRLVWVKWVLSIVKKTSGSNLDSVLDHVR